MGGMNFHGGGLLGFDMRTSQLSSELADLVFTKMPMYLRIFRLYRSCKKKPKHVRPLKSFLIS